MKTIYYGINCFWDHEGSSWRFYRYMDNGKGIGLRLGRLGIFIGSWEQEDGE